MKHFKYATYKQKQHIVSFATKLIATALYIVYAVTQDYFTIDQTDVQSLAMAVFMLFVFQIILQSISTLVFAIFVPKNQRYADERDETVSTKSDLVGGYILGIFVLIGLGTTAAGWGTHLLFITIAVGSILMGLVSDALKFYYYTNH